MTLVMTIASQWGIWQCMDTRLTDVATGKPSDVGVKYVSAKCPDGRFVLSYAGIGEFADTRETSEWIRDCLRGDTRTIVESVEVIRKTAQCEHARHMMELSKVVGARFDNREVWVAVISNLELASTGFTGDLLRRFETYTKKVEDPGFFARAGSGAAVISPADVEMLNRIKGRRPKDPNDFATLLADVNERVSHVDRNVSAACVTAVMHLEAGIEIRVHHGATSEALYYLLHGVDMTPMTRTLIEGLDRGGPIMGDLDASVRPGPKGSRPRGGSSAA